MKTLTEFSALVLAKAAAARAAAMANAPAPAPVAEAAPPAVEAPAADGEAAAADAPSDGGEVAPSDGGEAAASPEGEGDAKAAPAENPLVPAVAESLGVPADRAARLLEALDIIGGRTDQVRLVRVYQGETGPHGSVSRGEFHYAIDRVAGAQPRKRDDRGGKGGDRGGRGGGDRGGGGGGGGFGGFGDRKPAAPRGLGSLKMGAKKPETDDRDDRPGRGELPRAGMGWQLTAAPRDAKEGGGRGRGPGGPGGPRGPRRGPGGGGGPGGPRRDGGGYGGGGGGGSYGGPGGGGPGGGGGRDSRNLHGPRMGPDGMPLADQNAPYIPREPRAPRVEHRGGPRLGPDGQPLPPREPRPPRLGPDGQPLPREPRRDRKPMGPDASGNGPDGKPWDPERRAQRVAERAAQRPGEPGAFVNTPTVATVEAARPIDPSSSEPDPRNPDTK